ncbi:hypothetical protein M0R04_06995 [Candidatus Dojkabacteria bacterium]|jgi:predicted nucleic acid-binding Zn ribbon protein|nr:hypothetical protein [Candidatus Dojkabacteria bacterium]
MSFFEIIDAELLDRMRCLDILSQENKLSKKSYYILVKYPDLLADIQNRTDFILGDMKQTIRERLYCIKTHTTAPKNCIVCGKKVEFRGNGTQVGYPDSCSQQCGHISPKKTERRIETSLLSYGTKFPQQHDSVKIKTSLTNMTRYNRTHKNQNHIDDNTYSLLLSKDWLEDQHHTQHKTLSTIANELSVDITTIQRHLTKHNLCVKHFYKSTQEIELLQVFDNLKIYTECNTRTIIPPFELDIYVPEHKLAVEYCGLYWHSEQQGKGRHYHSLKYNRCKDIGIRLITIFSDEWEQQPDLVTQKIQSIVGQDQRDRIFARKCTVLGNVIAKSQFFNNHHIQGDGPGSINIGLNYNNTLVACMSFIKQKNDVFVLNRYATSSHTIGGFSKLLNYFKKNYKWNQIVSFADLRWSDGDLYEKNGFCLDKILPPDYCYSPSGHNRVHKFNYRRQFLPKLLKKFDPLLSETQNCDVNNILRIWDCGKLRYVLNNINI